MSDTERIDGPAYAMAVAEKPWRPDPRATVLQMVLRLAGDMKVSSIDKDAGIFSLAGKDGQLFIWQNLPGWTRSARHLSGNYASGMGAERRDLGMGRLKATSRS